MPVSERQPLIFLSAGESSGDHYGAEIIEALHALRPDLRCTGLGGLAMERAGQQRIVRAEEVAVMGITEILRHVPRIYARYRRLVREIRRERPDVAVLIDFPDVNFRLARELKRLGVPVVWFASPQLWAWKRRRLRWVKQRVDRMLVLFPFEERFYRARGVEAEFVGHPLADLPAMSSNRSGYAATHMSANSTAAAPSSQIERRWIALLPGSRWKEVRANLPMMLEGAAGLGPGYDFLIPVASTLSREAFAQLVFAELLPAMAWPAGSSVTLVPDAAEALHHARASVVASGTATVLAAVVGNPFVVVYRVSSVTFAIARRLVRYPAEMGAEADADGVLPVGMVNLIAGRRVVPELLNRRFTPEAVAAAIRPLLEDGPERAAQIAGLDEVRRSLRRESVPAGGASAGVYGTKRVAEVVVELLNAGSGAHVRSAGQRV